MPDIIQNCLYRYLDRAVNIEQKFQHKNILIATLWLKIWLWRINCSTCSNVSITNKLYQQMTRSHQIWCPLLQFIQNTWVAEPSSPPVSWFLSSVSLWVHTGSCSIPPNLHLQKTARYGAAWPCLPPGGRNMSVWGRIQPWDNCYYFLTLTTFN